MHAHTSILCISIDLAWHFVCCDHRLFYDILCACKIQFNHDKDIQSIDVS